MTVSKLFSLATHPQLEKRCLNLENILFNTTHIFIQRYTKPNKVFLRTTTLQDRETVDTHQSHHRREVRLLNLKYRSVREIKKDNTT